MCKEGQEGGFQIYLLFLLSLRLQKLLISERCQDPECLPNLPILRNRWMDGVNVPTSLIDSASTNFFIKNILHHVWGDKEGKMKRKKLLRGSSSEYKMCLIF